MNTLNDDRKLAELKDAVEEAQFSLLMYECMREEGKQLNEENERIKADPAFSVPEDMEKRILSSIRRECRGKDTNRILNAALKVSKRVAIFAGVLCIAFAGLCASVKAVRDAAYGFTMTRFGDHAIIRYVDESNIIAAPTWIPEGYRLTSCDSYGYKIFENDEGNQIIYNYADLSAGIYLDTEDLDVYEDVSINGNKGLLTVKKGLTTVLWLDMDKEIWSVVYAYNEDADTALAIAESVK